MEKEEAKNYIDDQVRHATDSAIMALTRIIGDHNIKLDNIKKAQEQDREVNDSFMKEMRSFISKFTPIEKEFKEKEQKKEVLLGLKKDAFSILVGITVIATAAISAKQILSWVISNIIQKQ